MKIGSKNSDVSNKNTDIKRQAASKKWCFSLYNYTKEEYDQLIRLGNENSNKFIIAKEKENDILCLKGFINFEKKIRPFEMKNFIKRIIWNRSKGSEKNNFILFTKGNDYETNIIIKKTKNEINVVSNISVGIDNSFNVLNIYNLCDNNKKLASIIEFNDNQCILKWNGKIKNLTIHNNLADIVTLYQSGDNKNRKLDLIHKY